MSVVLAACKAIYDLSEPEFHRVHAGDPEGFEALLEALTASEVADLLAWFEDPSVSLGCRSWVRH
jgi:hypothetical protein